MDYFFCDYFLVDIWNNISKYAILSLNNIIQSVQIKS